MIKQWPLSPKIFFFLTLCAGILILFPGMDFQVALSQGDHGRELYVFERTIKGDMAFRDYWWVYGPLMPYYYALFMKMLGVTIVSVLTGKAILNLASGLFIFLAIRPLSGPLTAFLGAAWFFLFHYEFIFTYNHAGGITVISAIAALTVRYIMTQKIHWLWLGVIAAFLLALIKLNFGAISILTLAFAAWLTDRMHRIKIDPRKTFFYSILLIGLPAILLAIYWSLVCRLSSNEILQCFPYLDKYLQYVITPWDAIKNLLQGMATKLSSNLTDSLFGAIVISCAARTLQCTLRKKIAPEKSRALLLAVIILGVYYVLCLHEYLKAGVYYEAFWPQPIGIILMFTVIATALSTFSKSIRMTIFGTILILAFFGYCGQTGDLGQLHDVQYYLDNPRAKIFVGNDIGWIKTVNTTVSFLKKTLQPKEAFLALPYEPLYYYLTNRKSPIWFLCICEAMNISPQQEQQLLCALEQTRVNYILLSSRQRAQEKGMGILGVTYCPLLAKYIKENFQPVAQFGDWQNEPGWAWNHGTMIFKRRTPLPVSK